MAASQCTMNNFTFGNATPPVLRDDLRRLGAGAPGFDGDGSVVQTHMTNSRLTDPEVLEFRFPVRLESYAIRRGSGGAGRWRGGDGGVRRVRFLEPMTASILSQRPPRAGLRHGRRRSRARWASTASSAPTAASRRSATSARPRWQPGDVFVIETPGGGGYGPR